MPASSSQPDASPQSRSVVTVESKNPVRVRVDRGIYKRTTKDGTTRYEVAFTDLDGRQRWRTAAKLQEARDLRASLVTKIRSGEQVASSNVTFGDYADQWLVKQTHLRPGTFDLYSSHLRTHLRPRYRRRLLSSLTLSDVLALIGELQAGVRYVGRGGSLVKQESKPLGAWTIRAIVVVLSRLLNTAVRDGVIASNPCRRLERGDRPAVEPREFPDLDREDIATLIVSTPTKYRTLVAVSVLTGLRQSEALGLRWQDIDVKTGSLRVRYQLDRTGKLVKPKTPAAKREVPFPPVLGKMLKAHKEAAFARGHAKPTDYVFADETGEPFHHRRIARAGLDPALAAAKLPSMTWHDLRHIAASVLIGQGASVVYVSRVLGHASPSVTLGTYAHAFAAKEHASETRDRMEAAFGDVLR